MIEWLKRFSYIIPFLLTFLSGLSIAGYAHIQYLNRADITKPHFLIIKPGDLNNNEKKYFNRGMLLAVIGFLGLIIVTSIFGFPYE